MQNLFSLYQMTIHIASLNSGSNGNCYYIGNENEAVLVDAGLSCRETEKRMRQLELSLSRVKAIFISHEHIDHVKGLPVLAEKYQLPVYITNTTLKHSRIKLDENLQVNFCAYTPVQIGNLTVTAFPKHHDAEDPHSFIISCNDVTVGVFTDIGAECSHVISQFKKCHAVFLETNYDEEMLEQGRYPWHLKNRIRGGKGHLSNKQALDIFLQHRHPALSHLLLSHLSKENNCPVKAKQLFDAHAGEVNIVIASRFEPTAVFSISGNGMNKPVRQPINRQLQLDLFDA
jgi:phosphoribosyl 1,2-cyclic phosphodiesterase